MIEQSENLFFLTDKNQKLPVDLTLLFHSAIKGDEKATDAIIKEFLPSIKKIASIVQCQHNLSDEQSFDLMVQSGIKTLKDFMVKHTDEGFCKFILFAIRINMNTCSNIRNHDL